MLAPHMRPTHPAGRSRIRFFRSAGAAIFLIALAAISVVCAAILLTWPDRASIGAAPPDVDARAVAFDSEDGTRMRGWYIDGRRGCGAVLLLHGIHADRRQMLGRARFLTAAGYSVLLADSRAHGESDGDAITFGYLESVDAEAALEYLRKQAPGERVGIVGVSMGGAAAVLAAPPPRIDALVVEQVYPTVDEALENRLRLYLGPPGSLLGDRCCWGGSRCVGWDAAHRACGFRGRPRTRVPPSTFQGRADGGTRVCAFPGKPEIRSATSHPTCRVEVAVCAPCRRLCFKRRRDRCPRSPHRP